MREVLTRSGGRKEVLTLGLARQIIKLIERMPDAEIPVTWDNVTSHVKQKLGKELRRNVLSQKEWDGRKLIAEAFKDAKKAQSRFSKQATPKYANSPRGVLRKKIGQLEAKVLALQQELEAVRDAQYTQLDLFRAKRMDLRQMTENASQGKGA